MSSGLIKPLSVTKSSLRDKTPPVYSSSEDIVRVRDLPNSVQNVQLHNVQAQSVRNSQANTNLFADDGENQSKIQISPDTNLGRRIHSILQK